MKKVMVFWQNSIGINAENIINKFKKDGIENIKESKQK